VGSINPSIDLRRDGDVAVITADNPPVNALKHEVRVGLQEAFRKAEQDKEPLLGYFYAPQWLLSEIDLVHVALPAYTPGCDADPKTVRCDYQPYDLDKIANRRFAYSGSPAAELIKNFQWTNDDQNQVARYLTVDKLSRDDAAKRWLDAHQSQWQAWLR